MKLTLITLIAVLLTACSTQDKTYTVQELLKEPALYKKISDWCSENPAERSLTPNCINALQALHELQANATLEDRGKPISAPQPIANFN
ncbi:MAG: EexN family lipoprotein [Methylococcaceae bacterium]|nr:EexN family lipoprotein [Methylococcaceae bacterium]